MEEWQARGIRNAVLAHASGRDLELRVTDLPDGAKLHVRDRLTGRTTERSLTERQLLDATELGVVLGDIEAELRPTRPPAPAPAPDLEVLLGRLVLELEPLRFEVTERHDDHVVVTVRTAGRVRLRPPA